MLHHTVHVTALYMCALKVAKRELGRMTSSVTDMRLTSRFS